MMRYVKQRGLSGIDRTLEGKEALLKQATWYPVATQACDENTVACLLGPMEAMLMT